MSVKPGFEDLISRSMEIATSEPPQPINWFIGQLTSAKLRLSRAFANQYSRFEREVERARIQLLLHVLFTNFKKVDDPKLSLTKPEVFLHVEKVLKKENIEPANATLIYILMDHLYYKYYPSAKGRDLTSYIGVSIPENAIEYYAVKPREPIMKSDEPLSFLPPLTQQSQSLQRQLPKQPQLQVQAQAQAQVAKHLKPPVQPVTTEINKADIHSNGEPVQKKLKYSKKALNTPSSSNSTESVNSLSKPTNFLRDHIIVFDTEDNDDVKFTNSQSSDLLSNLHSNRKRKIDDTISESTTSTDEEYDSAKGELDKDNPEDDLFANRIKKKSSSQLESNHAGDLIRQQPKNNFQADDLLKNKIIADNKLVNLLESTLQRNKHRMIDDRLHLKMLSEEREQLKEDIKRFAIERSNAVSELEKIKNDIKTKTTKLKEVDTKLLESAQRLEDEISRVNRSSGLLKSKVEELESCKEKKKELEDGIALKHVILSDLQNRIVKSKNEISNLETKSTDLKSQIQQLQNKRIYENEENETATSEKQKKIMEEILRIKERRIEELKEQEAELTALISKRQNELGIMDNGKAMDNGMATPIETRTTQFEGTNKPLTVTGKLRENNELSTQLGSRRENIEESRHEYANTCDNAKKEAEQPKENSSKESLLRTEQNNQDSDKIASEVSNQQKKLQELTQAVTTKKAELEESTQRLGLINTEINSRQSVMENLEQDLKKKGRDITTANSTIHANNLKLDDLNRKLSSVESRLSTLNQYEDLNSEISLKREELSTLISIQDLIATKARLIDETLAANARLIQMKEELERVQVMNDETISNTRTEIDELISKKTQKSTQVNELSDLLVSLSKKYTDKMGEYRKLVQSHNELETKNKNSKEMNDNYLSFQAKLVGDIERAKEVLRSQRQQNQALTDESNSIKKSWEDYRNTKISEVQETLDVLERFRASLNTKQEEVDRGFRVNEARRIRLLELEKSLLQRSNVVAELQRQLLGDNFTLEIPEPPALDKSLFEGISLNSKKSLNQ